MVVPTAATITLGERTLNRLANSTGAPVSCEGGATLPYQWTPISLSVAVVGVDIALDATPLVSFAVEDPMVATVLSTSTLLGTGVGSSDVYLAGRDTSFAKAGFSVVDTLVQAVNLLGRVVTSVVWQQPPPWMIGSAMFSVSAIATHNGCRVIVL